MTAPTSATDACPGVLRAHQAEDGLMVRLRIPGGRLNGPALAGLGALAARYGNPALQLTSRSGLQLRGLADPVPTEVVDGIEALGLLPSREHDRVRTIACSPLTGIQGGRTDLSPLVDELDRAVLAEPRLAELSGRFLTVLDDGRGDVIGLPFDLAYLAETDRRGRILVGDRSYGLPVSRDEAAATIVGLALDFLDHRPDPSVWHVRDLPAWVAHIATPESPAHVAAGPTPLGTVGHAASVLVPLGLLTPEQISAVTAAVGTGPLVLTTERGLVLPHAADALPSLVAAGLVADRSSPWSLVSACVGAPHCARTDVDTRAIAHDLVAAGRVEQRTHVSGCERRCGAPTGPYVDLVGTR